MTRCEIKGLARPTCLENLFCKCSTSLIQSEFNPDVEITSNEAKKTELRSRETVNCQYGCITSKQFVIQQSHLIQVVTDLSNQVTELNRKVDLLTVGQSAENFTTQEDNAEITILLASLPVKDDASFEDFITS